MTEQTTAIARRDQQQNQVATAYSKIADPLAFARELGPAASSIMGAPLDQGPAIALTALCEGYTLVEMRRRYHWIGGRPVMQAAAMLAEFRMNYGGDYEVTKRDAESCEIVFSDAAGRKYETKLTWQECEASRWPWVNWKDHSRGLKDNWATPLDRKTMMFARLVSDSLKFICPELAAGVYTPEEMLDVDDARQPTAPSKKASDVLAEQAARASVVADADGDDEIIDAPFEVVAEADAGAAESSDSRDFVDDPDEPGSIRKHQVDLVQSLFGELGMDADQQVKVLVKRGCQVIHNLSANQATELIDRMQQRLRASKN